MQFTITLSQIQAASVSDLEGYVARVTSLISQINAHMAFFPDEEANQAFQLEIAKLITIRKTFNVLLGERILEQSQLNQAAATDRTPLRRIA